MREVVYCHLTFVGLKKCRHGSEYFIGVKFAMPENNNAAMRTRLVPMSGNSSPVSSQQ
jgi:hypothetical protein